MRHERSVGSPRAGVLISWVTLLCSSLAVGSVAHAHSAHRSVPSPPADAREREPEEELTTREGTIIRGRLVEVHPSAGTIVMLDATDQRRVVRWSDVGTTNGPSFVEDRTVFSRVPVIGRAPLRVRSIHRQSIEVTWGTSRLRAEDHREGGELHRARCETPCTLWLPPTRVLVQSEAPELARGAAFVELHASGTTVQLHASDRTRHTVAEALMLGGLASLEAGLLVALGAFLVQPNGGSTLDTGLIVGGSLGGVGLLTGLAGAAIGATVPTGARSVEHAEAGAVWAPRPANGALAPWQRDPTAPSVAPIDAR